MQKWQKNSIFRAIQKCGVEPTSFDLEDDGLAVRVQSKRSASYFIVDENQRAYIGRYLVGDGTELPVDEHSWDALMRKFTLWVKDVQHDLETPDLWAELRQDAELFRSISSDVSENSPFSPDEQKAIATRLRDLVEHAARTHSLTETQVRILEAKIDYLVKAVGRIGRIDWRNAFVGAIISFIISAALEPESARNIFLQLVRGIGHFYGFPELPILD